MNVYCSTIKVSNIAAEYSAYNKWSQNYFELSIERMLASVFFFKNDQYSATCGIFIRKLSAKTPGNIVRHHLTQLKSQEHNQMVNQHQSVHKNRFVIDIGNHLHAQFVVL